MHAAKQFITLQDGAEAKAVIAPDLGGWLLRYMRHLPELGYVDALHFSEDVVDRYPEKMYAGNPVLFPLVSFNVAGGKEHFYEWRREGVPKGDLLPMPQHGFARRSKWKVVHVSELSLTMELSNNEATEKNYPFAFVHRLTYRLENARLYLEQEIRNRSPWSMPFSAGFHPYFAAPFTSKGRRDSCFVQLPRCRKMIPHGKMESFTAESFPSGRLRVDQDFSGTLFLTDLEKREIRFQDEASRLEVVLNWEEAPQYQFLALWSPATDSPFFCVEPWTALPNSFGRKDGELILLDPGAVSKALIWLELREMAISPAA